MPPDEPTMPDDNPTTADSGPDTLHVCCVSEREIGTQAGKSHENVETRILEAKRIREQLIQAIAVSHITLFAVDSNRKVTMLDGALVKGSPWAKSKWHIGKDVCDVFSRLDSNLPEGQMPPFLASLEAVLSGEVVEDVQKHEIRQMAFQPLFKKTSRADGTEDVSIDGAVGLLLDLAELRDHGMDFEAQQISQQVAKLFIAEGASDLKNQFLANVSSPSAPTEHLQSADSEEMSHEFRTPVVGVINMAQLLLVDDGLRREQRKLAVNIHRSAKTLLDLVNDILDFSKTDSDTLDIETVQFSPLPVIRDLADLLRFAAELKGLAFHFHIATNIKAAFQVMGDPGRLRQVLANLLANSVAADQGYVKFTVIKEHEGAETATLKFVVEDTGRITEEDIQTDTSTAKKSGRTEHGLSISKSVRGGILVLIAEDNPINQQFALTSIKKLGFQATAVGNGQEALRYMEAACQGKQPKPKIILMDIQMPIIDGYGCTDLLRHRVPLKDYADDVPIVALTASAIEGDKEKCKAVGMDDYMSKPITIDTLERVLVRWSIQGRTAAPPLDRHTSDFSDSSKQSDCYTPGTDSGESRMFVHSATEYDGTAFESWCPMS
ncbi:hypothetical protein NEMBOFW57_002617 [Staphylotrichum longicolle]|uniref:Uncharacterized protein n=1 Tax=Staphylotrichum longicolle TaxID=669026 RepID=A0AAD4F6E9_9PEZI|nr:hypothetical protein NEMBOFW57_002617 [Staphylotrichum longicolle]